MASTSERIIAEAQAEAAKMRKIERYQELQREGLEIRTTTFKTKWTPRQIEAISAWKGKKCRIAPEDLPALKQVLAKGALIFTTTAQVELALEERALASALSFRIIPILEKENETVGVTLEANEVAKRISYPAVNIDQVREIPLLRFWKNQE